MISLAAYLMRPRPEWNRMGPKIPAWFTSRLARVDKRLVLQFIPPRSIYAKDGADPRLFPRGVWAICRRLRGTKWLFKRWTWSLTDLNGKPREPGPDTIAMIRLARDLHRRGRDTALEEQLDVAIAESSLTQHRESKDRLLKQVAERLSELGRRTNPARVSMA